MNEQTQSGGADDGSAAFICPDETRGWRVWIDDSGFIPKLRAEGEVLVGDPGLRPMLSEGERIDGADGVVQYLDLSWAEGGTTRPDPNWMKVEAPDISAPDRDPSGRFYKSVLIVCDRRVYHKEDDPQPAGAGGCGGEPDPSGGSREGGEGGFIPCPFRDDRSRGWEAWLNAEPGPDPKRLIVVAEVDAPEGYSGRLRFTHMDKMLPPNQHAELSLVESPGTPGGWRAIRGELETDQECFNSVIVSCHGEPLTTISPVPVVV